MGRKKKEVVARTGIALIESGAVVNGDEGKKTFDESVAVIEKPVADLTPMAMIARAVDQGANVDQLSKLMDLQERWEKNEAKKAFDVDFNKFKSLGLNVTKTKNVNFKSLKGSDVDYDYAPLHEIMDIVNPHLSANNLSVSWDTKTADGKIYVTCILSHSRGHEKRVTLDGPADQSGSKNPLQSIGSSVSYLERYTVLAVLGLASKNSDDDARGSDDTIPHMDEAIIEKHIAEIRKAKDDVSLLMPYKDAMTEARKIGDKSAEARIIAVKDEMKKALGVK